MIIDPSRSICTVIVTVDGEAKDMAFLIDHASDALALFGAFPGFIAGAAHVSDDRARIIQYLQWESREAHEACMNDPAWAADEPGRRFGELAASGRIRVDVRIYDIAARTGPP